MRATIDAAKRDAAHPSSRPALVATLKKRAQVESNSQFEREDEFGESMVSLIGACKQLLCKRSAVRRQSVAKGDASEEEGSHRRTSQQTRRAPRAMRALRVR